MPLQIPWLTESKADKTWLDQSSDPPSTPGRVRFVPIRDKRSPLSHCSIVSPLFLLRLPLSPFVPARILEFFFSFPASISSNLSVSVSNDDSIYGIFLSLFLSPSSCPFAGISSSFSLVSFNIVSFNAPLYRKLQVKTFR